MYGLSVPLYVYRISYQYASPALDKREVDNDGRIQSMKRNVRPGCQRLWVFQVASRSTVRLPATSYNEVGNVVGGECGKAGCLFG